MRRGIDAGDDARPLGPDDHAAVLRDRPLHAGADHRRVGPQQRNRLALHVRTHQRAVGVVVLEERDQRRRDRNRLPRADVDVLNFLAGHRRQVALHAGQHEALAQVAVLLDDVRRGEDRPSSPRRRGGTCARR